MTGGRSLIRCFSFPISRLWVPRSCAFCKGGYDAADTMGCAQRPASHFWRASPALYHLFLLSAIALVELYQGPRPLSRAVGRRRASAGGTWGGRKFLFEVKWLESASGQKLTMSAASLPALAQNARAGHPLCWFYPRKSRAGPPVRTNQARRVARTRLEQGINREDYD